MRILVPGYYHKFKCIADRCKHNCCIGWEIDIDSDTAEYYKNIPAPFGDKIRSNIDLDCECPHFVLKAGERCPFLEKDGLCEIIKDLGEDALCDICTDHPRFRNFYSDFEELGLGLCCEEAGRVILSSNDPFSLVPLDENIDLSFDDEEKEMFDKRSFLFSIASDRSLDVYSRLEKLASVYCFDIKELYPHKQKELFLSLERLDESWTQILSDIKECDIPPKILSHNEFSVPFEQLLCYFLFRHFADGLDDGLYCERVKMCVSSVLLIAHLCDLRFEKNGFLDFFELCELARMFSSEIEYSDENLETIFNSL